MFEGQIDEGVFQPHRLLAAIDDVFLHRLGQAAAFLGHEGVEQLGDAFAVQRFIAHRPRDDLAHALHLVEAREVHQHGEAGEQLQAFGKAAEHGQGAGDVFVVIDAELCR
jgi:hypothetical protein